MIHYTCDCCNKRIDAQHDLLYVVRLEVYAALDPSEGGVDDDRDHLQEVQEILERMDDSADEQICDDVYHHQRFELCRECRQQFMKNPLGRVMPNQLDFSNN